MTRFYDELMRRADELGIDPDPKPAKYESRRAEMVFGREASIAASRGLTLVEYLDEIYRKATGGQDG